MLTADEGLRGGKPIPLKANTDEALLQMSRCEEPSWWSGIPAVRSP
ncbi:MAG: hypothetical protein WDN08_15590 [Rhizomicrobium sp.]